MPKIWRIIVVFSVVLGGVFAAYNPQTPVFEKGLIFYGKTLSRIDGNRCPGYPVCSLYSKQAYQQYGAVLGTFLTIDRLLREWAEIHDAKRQIYKEGKQRYFDPLNRNTFWLKDK